MLLRRGRRLQHRTSFQGSSPELLLVHRLPGFRRMLEEGVCLRMALSLLREILTPSNSKIPKIRRVEKVNNKILIYSRPDLAGQGSTLGGLDGAKERRGLLCLCLLGDSKRNSAFSKKMIEFWN